MNDTPVAAGDMPTDLDTVIDQLRTDDPAAAADRAEVIAQRLSVELDPPAADGATTTQPDG